MAQTGLNMLMSIRLVISDIDGTLVRQDKSLADATVAAFRRLRNAGIQATLISARAPSGMFSLADALDIAMPLGAFNGGTIFARNGVLLAWSRLDRADTRAVLTLSEKAGVDVWLFGEGKWYAHTLDNPRIARERLTSGLEPIVVSDLADVAVEADKIICFSERAELLRLLEHDACAAIGATTITPALLTFAEKLRYEGYLRREETNTAILGLSRQGFAIKEITRNRIQPRLDPEDPARTAVGRFPDPT